MKRFYGIIVIMKIRENVPIASLTTMRLGGNARYVLEIEELKDIPEAYRFASEKNLPTWIMGGGANTIGTDEGFDGVILLNKLRGIEVISETSDEVAVRAMGGEIWDDLVRFTAERGYSGIEAMAKIPGTVGAAPVQNIGAYGQDVSQVLESVEAYDTATGELVVLGIEDLKMGYRSTIFNTGNDAGRYFIAAITLVLENDEHLEPPFYNSLQKYLDDNKITDYSPESIMNAVAAVRASKLPDPEVEASAGSFFKNIFLTEKEAEEARARGIQVWDNSEGGERMVNSGWLIEKAGLKGKEFYGFRVSDKAALVLINDSARSYADLDKARSEIRKIVKAKFGYELQQEPVEIPNKEATK